MTFPEIKQFIQRSPIAFPLRWLRSLLLVARTYYKTQHLYEQVQQIECILSLKSAQLHEQLQQLEYTSAQQNGYIKTLENDLQQASALLENHSTLLENQITDIKRILYPSEHPFAWSTLAPPWQKNAESKLGKLADDITPEQKLHAFYSYFSEMALGHEQIRQQQYAIYTPKIKTESDLRFLDIGCGDGEFLSYLQTQGIAAVGIDIEQQEIDRASSKGLAAIKAYAQEFLSETEEQFCGISLLQVIEHLPPHELLTTLQQCVERLCPGGVLLLETINMRHPLAVNGFYTDPTHQKPLSDNYLSFLVQWLGLIDVQIIYNLPEQLPGVPDDDLTRIYSNYTVLGYKN